MPANKKRSDKNKNKKLYIKKQALKIKISDFHKTILSSSMDGFWIINNNKNIIAVNSAYSQMVGYSAEELLSMNVKDLEVKETPDEIKKHATTVEKKGFDRFETQHLCKDKSIIDLEISTNHFEGGRIFAFIRDITDRKITEESLLWHSEVNAVFAEISKKLISKDLSIEDISFIVLKEIRKLTKSQFGYVGYIDEDTGYLICPTLTKDIWNKCNVKEKSIVFKEFFGLWGRVLKKKKSILVNDLSKEMHSIGVPKGHIPIKKFLSSPAILDGKVVGQLALANKGQDYTERDLLLMERMADFYAMAIQRLRSLNALTISEKKYHNLFEHANDSIFIIDPETSCIIEVNENAAKQLGYTKKELMNMRVDDIDTPLAAKQNKAIIKKLIKNGSAVFEHAHRKKNGMDIPVEISSRMLKYGDKKVIQSFVRDISDRKKVKHELFLQKEFLQNVIDSLTHPFYVIDASDYSIVMANSIIKNISGDYPSKCYKLTHGLNKPCSFFKNECTLEKVIKNRGPVILEHIHYKKNGEPFHCEIHGFPIVDKNDNITKIIEYTLDITQRKKLEEKNIELLHKVQERVKELNCLYELSKIIERPDISIEKILRETIKIIPPSWQYSGITCARIIFENNEYKTHNYKRTKWIQSSDIKFKGEKAGQIEVIYRKKMPESDEGPFLKEERDLINALAERLGRVIERIRMEEELDILLNSVIKQSPVPMIMATANDRKIKIINKAGLNIFKIKDEKNLTEKVLSEIQPSWQICDNEGKPVELSETSLVKVLKGDVVKQKELMIKRHDGTIRWVVSNGWPIFNSSGKIIAGYVIFLDTTEVREIQQQLIQSEKMSAVGQLAAGVAHEFNNILTIIKGNSQLGLMDPSIDEITDSLNIINETVDRGRNLIRDLQIFSKPKELKSVLGDITKVIDEVYLLQKKQLSLEDIKIIKKYDKHSNFFFDWGQMEQVFSNLFINARHAMKPDRKGKITVSVKDEGSNIQVKFKDTGIGMDEKVKKKIFEPFFTTKSAFAKDNLQIKGTGLGLSVKHSIIQEHKGVIRVESKKGKGTAFILSFPIAKGIKKIKKTVKKKRIKPDTERTKDLKILIVDDEIYIINLMKSIFKKVGHTKVVVRSNGKEALNVLKIFKPDVLFLDYLMPDISGEQVLEQIKSMKIKIPVVIMSGDMGINKNKLIRKGAFELIEKPFNVDEVFKVLNKVVKGKK